MDDNYEDHNAKKDHEMVQQQLSNVKANVEQLLEQCSCESPRVIEAWVQSKVTLANDYLDSVHSYVVNGGPMKKDKYKDDKDDKDDFATAVEKSVASKY